MAHLSFTILLAGCLVLLALFGLGLGYIVAKKKLDKRCGYNPDDNKNESCGEKKSCHLCQHHDQDE